MPNQILKPDLCIIGGGAGGLSIAAGASQMGADVVLLEGHKMGGDCLNVGCVPSKSILAAAHNAHKIRHGAPNMGIAGKDPHVNMDAVRNHINNVIETISHHDSVERFEGLGVNVIQEYGSFNSSTEVQAGDYKIQARKFVIATGSTPVVPPITGIDNVPYMTNDNVFELAELPKHLIVIGGGPIGCELSQAFRYLGSEVSTVSLSPIMMHDDPEAVDIARQKFVADGIELYEEALIENILKDGSQITVTLKTKDGKEKTIRGSHLLVAAGQKADLDRLNLENANIKADEQGIIVDIGMRTSNKKVFAVGDVTNTYQFTHIAGYQAGIVIQRALFKIPAKANYEALPWVTYTDPEVANIGMNEPMAKKKLGEGNFQVLKWPYKDNDRAQAERVTEGFIKVIIKPNGQILGATIVGKNAGELLLTWSLAISKKMKVGDIAQLIAPYPTISEISKRAAGSYFTPKIYSPTVKKIVQLLKIFG